MLRVEGRPVGIRNARSTFAGGESTDEAIRERPGALADQIVDYAVRSRD
jgi:hypothetical protein